MSKGTIIQTKRVQAPGGKELLFVVQLKGCPLVCTFCTSPESIKKAPEFTLETAQCSLCGQCVSVCQTNALYMEDERVIFNPQSCRMCDSCQDTCPNHAIGVIGKWVHDDAMAREILASMAGYERVSILLDGGEPFMQASFTYNLLAQLKNGGVYTCVTTSGYTPWEYLENTAPYVDCFIYNLKHMDNEKHSQFTGVSNRLVLENFVKLTGIHKNVVVQYKAVPGFNDSPQEAAAIFQFARGQGVDKIRISPYQSDAVSPFFQWRTGKKRSAFDSLSKDSREQLTQLAREHQLTVVEA